MTTTIITGPGFRAVLAADVSHAAKLLHMLLWLHEDMGAATAAAALGVSLRQAERAAAELAAAKLLTVQPRWKGRRWVPLPPSAEALKKATPPQQVTLDEAIARVIEKAANEPTAADRRAAKKWGRGHQ